MTARHEWQIGEPGAWLDLVKPDGEPQSGWWFETMSGGFDLGSAEATTRVLASLLFAGDDVRLDRYGTRPVTFTVKAAGHNSKDTHSGAKALDLWVGRPAWLRWVPPDGVAEPTLFRVRFSVKQLVTDDWEWARPGVKYLTYTLRLSCEPWGYDEYETTETFARASGVATVVDNASSATDWPGMTAGTYLAETVVSTPFLGGISGGNPQLVEVRCTDALPAPGVAAYLFIDAATEGGGLGGIGSGQIGGRVGGVRPVASIPLASGFTRYVFVNSLPEFTAFRWFVDLNAHDLASAGVRLHVNEVGTMTTLPSSSLLAMTMRGSVRVPARLRITSPGGDLEDTFVYSDPTMLGYGWDPATVTTWANAPTGDWTFVIYVNPDSYAEGDLIEVTYRGHTSSTVAPLGGFAGEWFPVGPFHLGNRKDRRLGAIGDGQVPTLDINGAGATGAFRLFREAPDVALIHLVDLTGTRLFVDPPSHEHLLPGLFMGTAADGSDAVSVLDLAESWGWPVLLPGTTGLYVACAVGDPEVVAYHRAAFGDFVAP